MPYDLFISYSRRDNERGQVAALAEQIKTTFRSFADRELQVFFDVREIHGMDDWRQKIQQSLRESHLFLAVLSPAYLASPYCRWEWEDYVRYEAMRQCLGEGVAPVFFVTLPDAKAPLTDRAINDWLDEIYRRQTFDLRPWHDDGEKALQQVHVKETLDRLNTSLRERLDRAERARRSPGNVLSHSRQFVGRVRELTALRNALIKNKLGIVGVGQPEVMATVQGVGGMGKTELALAYAHAFASDYPGGRWQLDCEHKADLRVALLHLAGPMNFEFTDEEKKSLALGFERVLRELDRRERCLLVLDNVSNAAIFEPIYLDRLPRDGHVDLVATTRLAPASIPGSAQNLTFIPVDELPEEDAVSLLRSHQPDGRFPSQAEDDEARTIAKLLEGFTLAVETAAMFLGRHPGADACRTFRERLKASLLETSEDAADDRAVGIRHHEKLLRKTLEFTFEMIGPEAMHLLTLASLLPADSVAIPWLQAVGAADVPDFRDDAAVPTLVFRQTVDLLLGLRLFKTTNAMDAEGRLLVARMHRLVQAVVVARLQPDVVDVRRQSLVAHAMSRGEFLQEGWVDHSARWEVDPLRAFALSLLETNHVEPGIELANLVQEPLSQLWQHGECRLLLQRALAISENVYPPDHPQLARIYSGLAAVSDPVEALRLAHQAVAIVEKTYGPDHPERSRMYARLAAAQLHVGNPVEALRMQLQAVALVEHIYAPDHPERASRYAGLAAIQSHLGNLSEGRRLSEQSMTIWKKSLAPDHPWLARGYSNLATLERCMGNLPEARNLLQQAAAVRERAYPPDHPEQASGYNNQGVVEMDLGNLVEARQLLQRAVAIDEKWYGPDHRHLANRYFNLALIEMNLGNPADARQWLQRAIAIWENADMPHDRLLTQCYFKLALVELRLGHFREALRLTLRVFRLWLSWLRG